MAAPTLSIPSGQAASGHWKESHVDIIIGGLLDGKGNRLEKNWSGLLSNIYVSFDAFRDIINDDNNPSYTHIYAAI